MIDIKTEKEIQVMREGGHILAEVLSEVLKKVKVGISELELDKFAEEQIFKRGGEPGFKKVDNYPNTICVSTNDVVVHGVPTNYRFKEGDVVGIDCGVFYKGFHTDMAQTLRVKNQNRSFLRNPKIKSSEDEKIDKFLETGERALFEAIKEAKIGNRIGHISKKIQEIIEGAGYSVVRTLVGHGVGKKLHEDPQVPGFLHQSISKTPKLLEGMTITVEVIYNMGKPEVFTSHDKWTIKSKDQSLSAIFERSIAITKNGPLILTQ